MSINKKALTRYLAYDRCLHNRGRKYTWKDLLDEANRALSQEGLEGIGKTQLYADLQFLEYSEWKAPIERFKSGRTVYFRYADPAYSIGNQPLSETEGRQLNAAIDVLSRFKGMPQFGWVNEIIPALETRLKLTPINRSVICFENNEDYAGLIHITPLFNAIVHKRVLKITYKDFRSSLPYDILFHPYYLKQYNSRWFVFGYNADKEIPTWNMALDRIEAIEEVQANYIESNTDWDDYFYDLVGVTRQKEAPEEVRLFFTPDQAPYIVTKPLHPTQKHKNSEAGLDVTIRVIPNYELERTILSFGKNVKVLAPDKLRLAVEEKLRLALSQYQTETYGQQHGL